MTATVNERRALFVTLSNIGDAVMTTPALQRLHEAMPEAKIDIIADARSGLIFEHCPYRGEIFLRDKRSGWRGLLHLIQRLRRRHYEVIADLRTDGLAYLLRVKRRLLKRHVRAVYGHAVLRHLAIVAALEHRTAPPVTQIWLSPAEYAYADGVLSRLPPGRWLALGPGANWPPKIWPVENYAALVEVVADRFDCVIVCGGPGDTGLAAELMQRLPMPAINLAGTTDLLQVAAVIKRADCFVGNDSGLGHIAAAMGTPTVTVFGPGEADRYHPWGSVADWIVAPGKDLSRLEPRAVAARLNILMSTPKPLADGSGPLLQNAFSTPVQPLYR